MFYTISGTDTDLGLLTGTGVLWNLVIRNIERLERAKYEGMSTVYGGRESCATDNKYFSVLCIQSYCVILFSHLCDLSPCKCFLAGVGVRLK